MRDRGSPATHKPELTLPEQKEFYQAEKRQMARHPNFSALHESEPHIKEFSLCGTEELHFSVALYLSLTAPLVCNTAYPAVVWMSPTHITKTS